jgi:hypothetical protein
MLPAALICWDLSAAPALGDALAIAELLLGHLDF